MTQARLKHYQLSASAPRLRGQPAEQLAVMQEVRPQHLGHDENPLRVADLLQDLLGQQRCSRLPALGGARRARVTGLAEEGEQVLAVTLRALDTGETMLEKTATQIPPHLLIDQAALRRDFQIRESGQAGWEYFIQQRLVNFLSRK